MSEAETTTTKQPEEPKEPKKPQKPEPKRWPIDKRRERRRLIAEQTLRVLDLGYYSKKLKVPTLDDIPDPPPKKEEEDAADVSAPPVPEKDVSAVAGPSGGEPQVVEGGAPLKEQVPKDHIGDFPKRVVQDDSQQQDDQTTVDSVDGAPTLDAVQEADALVPPPAATDGPSPASALAPVGADGDGVTVDAMEVDESQTGLLKAAEQGSGDVTATDDDAPIVENAEGDFSARKGKRRCPGRDPRATRGSKRVTRFAEPRRDVEIPPIPEEDRIYIKEDIEKMEEATVFQSPPSLAHWKEDKPDFGDTPLLQLAIEQMSTLIGAHALKQSQEDKVVGVLNFASAKKPGGGFLSGSQAQEESIARSASLYKSLITQQAMQFYRLHNNDPHGGYYSHSMIYTPGTTVFRDDDGKWLDPYNVDILTSCAVNAGDVRTKWRKQHPDEDCNEPNMALEIGIARVMRERMARLLYLFEKNKVRHLVLGSFGTGVFANDVPTVARLWFDLLAKENARFEKSFDQVLFAILDEDTLNKFKATFEESLANYSSDMEFEQFLEAAPDPLVDPANAGSEDVEEPEPVSVLEKPDTGPALSIEEVLDIGREAYESHQVLPGLSSLEQKQGGGGGSVGDSKGV